MKLQMYHALWGMTGTMRERLSRAATNGYDGIETPLPGPQEEAEFRELLEEFNLKLIPQIFSYDDHQETFAAQVEQAQTFSPVLINSHSAKDFMTEDEQYRFFEYALQVERKAGIAIGHETHRGRAMFTPRATARLLREFPDLKITADFSHFTCVCESLLHDQEEDVALAISRALHIHARVGHIEGPQVPHPAAPEFAAELERFEGWWEAMLATRREQGAPFSTVTPEFGPPNYMPALPFTKQAVSDLFEVNHWIAGRFRSKYE